MNAKGVKIQVEAVYFKRQRSNYPSLFSDCHRGQSLIVTAISEGRQAARQIDLDLMGETSLAGPGGQIHSVTPITRAIQSAA